MFWVRDLGRAQQGDSSTPCGLSITVSHWHATWLVWRVQRGSIPFLTLWWEQGKAGVVNRPFPHSIIVKLFHGFFPAGRLGF